jgi:hypothetical protein
MGSSPDPGSITCGQRAVGGGSGAPGATTPASSSPTPSPTGGRSRGWRWIVLGAACIAAVVLTSCAADPAPSPGAGADTSAVPPATADGSDTLLIGRAGTWMGDAAAPSVAVIGDSIVYQAEGNDGPVPTSRLLAEALVASGYRAYVSSWVGTTIGQAHDQVWPTVAREPELDILVVALGTNDIKKGVALAESRSVLDRWLAEAPHARCVALVGVNEHAFAWGLDVEGPPFNAMLQDLAGSRTDTVYVPWDPDLDIHGRDGDVHLKTPAAQAQYRTTLQCAADSCAARLEPAPASAG